MRRANPFDERVSEPSHEESTRQDRRRKLDLAAVEEDIRREARKSERAEVGKNAFADRKGFSMRLATTASYEWPGYETSEVGLDPTDDALVNSCEEHPHQLLTRTERIRGTNSSSKVGPLDRTLAGDGPG